MRIQKSSRLAVILLAIVVVILTSMVVANATQTITTPNAAFISYNLAVGTNSAVITPANNKPVLVMGCCTTGGSQSFGQVTLFHIPSVGMMWAGLESQTSFTSPTSTFSCISNNCGPMSQQGTHIVYIDLNHFVDIQVSSADTIRIRNAVGTAKTGNVTLIW